MIVDDEPYNILALKNMLHIIAKEKLEGICDEASNGQQALDLVITNIKENEKLVMERCDYGLIIIDFNMPIMDGNEATSKIRKVI